MSAEKISAIREQNNNTTVERLLLDESITQNDPIPNPVETFAQCFAKYPDLMGMTWFRNSCIWFVHFYVVVRVN